MGQVHLNLDFGEGRTISWWFDVVENSNSNLLGVDAMAHYDISLNIADKTVVFNKTKEENTNILCVQSVDAETENKLSTSKQAENIHHVHSANDILEFDFHDIKSSDILPEDPLWDDEDCEIVEETEGMIRTKIESLNIHTEVKKLLLKYIEITDPLFVKGKFVPGFKYHIDLKDNEPIYCPPRRTPFALKKKFKKLLRHFIERGIIERTTSSRYCNPCHLVVKRSGALRCTLDMRRTNLKIIPKKFPLPKIEDLLLMMKNSTYFSCLDLRDSFFSIACTEQTSEILTFMCDFGLFRFRTAVQGTSTSAEFFSSIITYLFRECDDYLAHYVDDLLVHSSSEEEHLKHLENVFKILKENHLILQPAKCKFLVEETNFLGYQITANGLRPLRSKIQAILDLQRPSNHTLLRMYVGMIQYNRRFYWNLTETLKPLYDMLDRTRKKEKLNWSMDQIKAFDMSKQALLQAVEIAYFDQEKDLHVYCDSSKNTVAGVLTQESEDGETKQILSLFSRPLNDSEKKQTIYMLELFALRASLLSFHYYIYHRPLNVHVDNKAVYSLLKDPDRKKMPAIIHRAVVDIINYNPNIHLLSSQNNFLPDLLTRCSCFNQHDKDQSKLIGMLILSDLNQDYKDLMESQYTDDELQKLRSTPEGNSLELVSRPVEGSDLKLYGVINSGKFRPIITKKLRYKFFQKYHKNNGHPGVRRTRAIMVEQVFWPAMKTDIAYYVKTCETCQSYKIWKHEKTKLIKFQAPTTKFNCVFSDYAGPLPLCGDKRYIVFFVDRYSRFFVAVPTRTQTASELCEIFMLHWFCRHGAPSVLVSDMGANYQSKEFNDLLKWMGTTHRYTNSFTPRENFAEHIVKMTKSALRCSDDNTNWATNLPIVTLSLLNMISQDNYTAAQYTYGIQLSLPQTLLEIEDTPNDVSQQVQSLIKFARIAGQRPFQNHPQRPSQRLKGLESATHIYLREGKRTGPFDKRYRGPYQLLSLKEKSAVIFKNNHACKVSRDRIKPYFMLKLSDIPIEDLVQKLQPSTDNLNLDDKINEDSDASESNRPQNTETETKEQRLPATTAESAPCKSTEKKSAHLNNENRAETVEVEIPEENVPLFESDLESTASSNEEFDISSEEEISDTIQVDDDYQPSKDIHNIGKKVLPVRKRNKPLSYGFEYNY